MGSEVCAGESGLHVPYECYDLLRSRFLYQAVVVVVVVVVVEVSLNKLLDSRVVLLAVVDRSSSQPLGCHCRARTVSKQVHRHSKLCDGLREVILLKP